MRSGLIAADLRDICELSTDIDTTTFQQPGIMGSTIVNEKVTRLIDLDAIAQIFASGMVYESRCPRINKRFAEDDSRGRGLHILSQATRVVL